MDRHTTPRVAFFGGSFDPPHIGHLAVARAARDALQLDTVLFAPVGTQPLKPEGPCATFAQRVEMVKLAIRQEPGLAVSLADAPRADGGPNYTLETLRRLRRELPSTGELFCLMGADSMANLRSWHGAAEIPFAASLVVASRPGQSLDDFGDLLPKGLSIAPEGIERGSGAPGPLRGCVIRNAKGACATVYILPEVDVPVSATEIRAGARSGELSRWVPLAVAQYIQDQRLYL